MPLYFAYGSNVNAGQMKRRCPSARFVARACLRGHELIFAGWSGRWGGGVASLRPAPKSRRAWGVLWEMTTEDLERLDHYEGAPFSYERTRRKVLTVRGDAAIAWVYIMSGEVPLFGPSPSYLETIASGYHAVGLGLEPLFEAAGWTWSKAG